MKISKNQQGLTVVTWLIAVAVVLVVVGVGVFVYNRNYNTGYTKEGDANYEEYKAESQQTFEALQERNNQ